MAVIFSTVTLGEQAIIVVDQAPQLGLGTPAFIGDLAIVDEQAGLYQKTGALDTQWSKFSLGSENLVSSVSSATTTTTSSTSDILVTGMTITPIAGSYLVFFQSSISSSSGSANTFFSVYQGGVKVNASEVVVRQNSTANILTVALVGIPVTVNGSQAIETRWRTSTGTATLKASGRFMTIMKVG